MASANVCKAAGQTDSFPSAGRAEPVEKRPRLSANGCGGTPPPKAFVCGPVREPVCMILCGFQPEGGRDTGRLEDIRSETDFSLFLVCGLRAPPDGPPHLSAIRSLHLPSRLASRGKDRPEAAESVWDLLLGRWCPSRALLHSMLVLAWAAGFSPLDDICPQNRRAAALWKRAVDPDSGCRAAVPIPG